MSINWVDVTVFVGVFLIGFQSGWYARRRDRE